MSDVKEYAVGWREGSCAEAIAWIDKHTGRAERVAFIGREGQRVELTGEDFWRFYAAIAQPARMPLRIERDDIERWLVGTDVCRMEKVL